MIKLSPMMAIAGAVVDDLIAARKVVATAESCTGGWISKMLTDVEGSSNCFGYGIVSYSNGAKESLLGVNPATLQEHGAVSEAVVKEMAVGVIALSGAHCAVAVSGIAGPDGGTEEKPVGTVWICWATRSSTKTDVVASAHQFAGDRDDVRSQAVITALEGVRDRIRKRG